MLFRKGVLSAFVVLVFTACVKTGPADIPNYIYIPQFEIVNDTTEMEIFSHAISDVWVYVDNDNQGAYELPALIPFAESGKHLLELRPGIKNAGIANDRRPYPYYSLYAETKNFSPGKTDTLVPPTSYNFIERNIKVAWEEQFESLGPSYDINPQSDTIVTIIDSLEYPDLVFRGKRSGAIILEEPGIRFELASPSLILPRNNIPIYLELNYKSDYPFTIGVYKDNKSEQIPLFIVKEQDDWNKIYLDISPYVQTSAPGTNFNIFIGFVRRIDVSKVEIYLDNIKLVHFQ